MLDSRAGRRTEGGGCMTARLCTSELVQHGVISPSRLRPPSCFARWLSPVLVRVRLHPRLQFSYLRFVSKTSGFFLQATISSPRLLVQWGAGNRCRPGGQLLRLVALSSYGSVRSGRVRPRSPKRVRGIRNERSAG